MRITPPPVEIGALDGFTNGDIFGREDLGRGLANLLSRIDEPLVIALDGAWGTGKTTFLKMWTGNLRLAGFPVVRFDAFENDYFDDPFLALAGEIVALTQSRRAEQTPEGLAFLSKATKAGGVLLRSALKVGVKAATFNAIDTEALADEISLAVADEASDLTDKYVGSLLTKHGEQRAALDAFRASLSALPALLTHPNPPRPLVVIIDELDRCRPGFALQMLERIKHFFAVPNVHFVLGVNLEQLQNSVLITYGSAVDANLYLQKFIQLRFSLPDSSEEIADRAASKYIRHLVKTFNFPAADRDAVDTFCVMLLRVVDHKGWSLRQIERVFSVFSLSLAFSPKDIFRPAHLLAGLCIIKASNPSLFDLLKSRRAGYASVAPELMLIDGDITGVEINNPQTRASVWWAYTLGRPIPAPNVSPLEEYFGRYGIDPRQAVPFVASHIVDGLGLQQR